MSRPHIWNTTIAATFVALHVLIQLALLARALLRPHRDPASRIAWVVVIVALPVLGILAYILFGEVNIGHSRVRQMREVLERMPDVNVAVGAGAINLQPELPERHAHLFRVGHSISGFEPIGGNSGCLLEDSDATIDAMVADDLGSRTMVHSEHWQAMRAAGVRLARALPIGNPLLRALKGRIDLRNDSWIVAAASRSYYGDLLDAGVRIFEYQGGLLHTKSLTLDGEVTLIGSANMDRRSFELNYENNILLHDARLTADMRRRQDSYIAKSRPITPETVEGWTWRRRLWNNAIAMLGPVL